MQLRNFLLKHPDDLLTVVENRGLVDSASRLNEMEVDTLLEILGNQIDSPSNWLIGISILIQTIVTAVLVFIVWSSKRIAKQQKDITDKQLDILRVQTNLALHERRFIIYESLMTLIGAAIGNKTLANDDLTKLWMYSKEGDFILDDDLNSYIQEIQTRCNIFVKLTQNEPRILGEEYDEWVLKLEKEQVFFSNAFEEIPPKFNKYLGFKEITYK